MHNEATTETATLETVLSEENMREAWLAVKANGGAPGVDGRDVSATAEHLRTHWKGIRAKLTAGDYKPGAVRAVDIPKASGGTRRLDPGANPLVRDAGLLKQSVDAAWPGPGRGGGLHLAVRRHPDHRRILDQPPRAVQQQGAARPLPPPQGVVLAGAGSLPRVCRAAGGEVVKREVRKWERADTRQFNSSSVANDARNT